MEFPLDPAVKKITVQELKKKIEAGEGLLLVDVNPRDRFDKHHIKGAVFVEYETAARWLIQNKVPKGRQIVLYCENTLCTASPIVANKLVKLGFTDVSDMPEGIQGWKKAGLEWEGTDKQA